MASNSNIREIFFDKKLEEEISTIGFVTIKEFLSPKECSDLETFYQENKITDDREFTISNWNNDLPRRTKTFSYIKDKILPVANTILSAYEPVMGVFTVKQPGNSSEMLIHQDWSLVDETKYRSVSIWVALCDMDINNGNLQLAEKSHIYCGFPRGMNIPVPFENIRQDFHKALKNVPLKKGDAIIFDHRVIHASPINKSQQVRMAAVLALIPKEAEMIHYYKRPGYADQLDILLMDRDKFHLIDFFDISKEPEHKKLLRSVNVEFPALENIDIPS